MSYRLSASPSALTLRAELLARTREFFAARGVLEIETPALSPAGNTDPALTSLVTLVESLGARDHYLQTSPEYAMKRLLAAGLGDIYQICRVFRDGELGRWHQPEFTMLEWYRIGWSEDQLIEEVGDLLRELLAPSRRIGDVVRLSYGEAFARELGVDPHADAKALREKLRERGIDPPTDLDEDGLRDLALSELVIPAFEQRTLVFIYDFPATQAALARIRPTDPPVAARFEAFLSGVELANGFLELVDATEQQQRFEAENRMRSSRGLSTVPIDGDFLVALTEGLPECAGVAVGFDRVVALALGAQTVAAAIAFAHERDS